MKRQQSPHFSRKYGNKTPNKIIYIFTEGEKTEVNYFRAKSKEIEIAIRRKNIRIEVNGQGRNTLSLVDYALNFVLRNNIDIEDCDECWVVFDKDDFDKNFDKSIKKTIVNKLKVAYSNESFELGFYFIFVI